jgi:hypothetical protein
MFGSTRARLRPMLACAASAVALMGLATTPAHAEWLKAETAHFIIYGDTSRGEIERYAQKLEKFDSVLRAYYPIRVNHDIPKLDIVLANGDRDMNKMEPGISGSVAGFYTPDSGRIFAIANTRSSLGDVVLFHEYSHHFMFQMTSAAYPSWFVEGFAEYYGQADMGPGKIEIGRMSAGRMNSLTGGANTWAPTEDVLRWRISRSGRFRGFDYYAQSWGLAHYMLGNPERTRQLGQYLTLTAAGTDPVQALQTSFNRTPAQLQNDLRRYLLNDISSLTPQLDIPPATVEVSALSAVEGRMIWYDFRLDGDPYDPKDLPTDASEDDRRKAAKAREEAEQQERDLVRDALADSAPYQTDRMGILVKARAQRLGGDPAAAFDTLEPLLTATTTDATVLRLAGVFLLDMAKKETDPAISTGMKGQARSYVARSLDADPMDFRTYLVLDDSRQGAPGYPNDNDLSVLEVASTLAPQSSDARVRTARAYLAHNEPQLAIVMLTPVVNNPHGGSGLGPIRTLLAQARAAAGLTPTTTDEAPPEDAGVEEGQDAG